MTSIATDFSDAYVPPVLTATEVQRVMKKRIQGIFNSKETRDEALVCVRQLGENPDDKVITLNMTIKSFAVLNMPEWLYQIKRWQALGVAIYKTNIVAIKCGAYGDAWMMTITPPGDYVPACPLALSFNVMVSGYSYIAKDKGVLEIAWSAMGKRE